MSNTPRPVPWLSYSGVGNILTGNVKHVVDPDQLWANWDFNAVMTELLLGNGKLLANKAYCAAV